MTILVTGANGLIGSHIVRSLLKRDYAVRALVRDNADLRNLDGLNVELVRGDLLKAGSIVDAATGCKAIIHTAGLTSTSPYDRWRVWEVNFIGAANVLTAAYAAGVEKVIYTASIFTLGVGGNRQPVAEDVEDNLRRLKFAYIAARRAAQAKAEKFAATGMPIVYVYPTYCLGPGLHNVNIPPQRQIIACLRGGLPFCPSGGLNIVDARDVGEAHVLALENGGIGQKYLVGGENVTFRELFARLGKAAQRRMLVLPVPNGAIRAGGWLLQWFSSAPLMDAATARLTGYRWYYDSTKAMNELGYSPRPLDETLRDTVAWLRENRYIR
jgi:dihydroflavonol-4-reductase